MWASNVPEKEQYNHEIEKMVTRELCKRLESIVFFIAMYVNPALPEFKLA